VTETTVTTGKLADSAGLLVVRRVGVSVVTALSSIVVVRSLGPDHFGQYAAGLAAYYLLTALTEFGFGQVLGMAAGRGEAEGNGLARLVLRVSVLWSCGVAVSGAVIAALFAVGTIRGGTLLVLVPAIAFAGTSVVRQFFYAHHRVGRIAAIDLSTSITSAVAVAALAVLGVSAVLLAAVTSAASVINSVLVLRAARRWMGPRISEPGAATRLLRRALPIGIAGFLATAYGSIDVVILSWLFPGAVVGRYAGAVKVLSLLAIFPGLVMSIALPQIAADWNDSDRLGILLTRLWHWFMTLVMPGLAAVAVNAAGVMTILFGAGYAGAAGCLRILMLAGAAAMFSNLINSVVVAAARSRWLVTQNVVALSLNVCGNLLLTPHFGIAMAAWLTVVTEVFVCAGSWALLRRSVPVRGLVKVSLVPLGVTAVAVGVGSLFSSRPWLALSLSAALYLILLTAVRGWPVEFRRFLPGRARSTVAAGVR